MRERKFLFFTALCFGAAIGLVISLTSREVWRAEAVVLVRVDAPGLSGRGPSKFWGAQNDREVESVLASLRSNDFVARLVRRNGSHLKEYLSSGDYQSLTLDRADFFEVRRLIFDSKALSFSEKNGLIKIEVRMRSAKQAAEFANLISREFNDFLRSQIISELEVKKNRLRTGLVRAQGPSEVKIITGALEQNAREIIEASQSGSDKLVIVNSALVPVFREFPKRRVIILQYSIAAFFISLLIIFGLEEYRRFGRASQ